MSVLSFPFLKRKTCSSVKVHLYENETLADLTTYTEYHLTEIAEAIDAVLNQKKRSFWFEANIYEKCGFFWKKQMFIEVVFQKESQNSSSGKKRISIPQDFLQTFFNKKLQIEPKKILVKSWPKPLFIELYSC